MLRLEKEPRFTHDVTAMIPSDGGHNAQTFKATFRLMSVDEMSDHNTMDTAGTTEFLRAVVVGLDDIEDEAGKPVPYSHALRDQLISLPPIMNALFKAYVDACNLARVGN